MMDATGTKPLRRLPHCLDGRWAARAGLTVRLHPHLLRHAWAHQMLAAGMQETDLMAIAGSRTRDMVARYAATRAERALAVGRLLSTVDRLTTES